ncbi:Pestheic acid cluster transcriptional regulator, partial [Lachnellula suecica]
RNFVTPVKISPGTTDPFNEELRRLLDVPFEEKEITCHFDYEKPPWMDGGFGQKEKAEEVKREVRSAAARRRGETLPSPMDVTPPMEVVVSIAAETDKHASEPIPDPSPGWISTYTRPTIEPMSVNDHPGFWNGLDELSTSRSLDGTPGNPELDRRFMMFYLDHFFPFLFPFYKPPLLEGGRTWILELVVGNQAMWHTTLCLSTYFVSVALDGTISGHIVCKTLAWEKLLHQMGVTFMMLHQNLQEIVSSNTQDLVVKTSRIMGSIIQLQRFEISVGNFENCQKHLGAAIELFKQIFKAVQNVTDGGELPTFLDVLSHMGRPLWVIKSQPSRAWSSDQAAFRFYAALLVIDDIIASTCMEEPPKLLEYHRRLLTNGGSPDERLLNLEDFIGCENWVMLQIGEIAALEAWKKSTRKAAGLI